MADNQNVQASANYEVATDKGTYSDDTDRNLQLMRPAHAEGSEGSKVITALTTEEGVKVVLADGFDGDLLVLDESGNVPIAIQAVGANMAMIAKGDRAHDATDIGDPVKIGGVASAATPTAVSADGDRAQLWLGKNGQAVVIDTISASAGADAVSPVANLPIIGGTGGAASGRIAPNYVFNGTNWDRARSGGVTGMQGVSGDTAHDAADAGNPVKIGGTSSTAVPSATSADGDRVNGWFTRNGAQVVAIGGSGGFVAQGQHGNADAGSDTGIGMRVTPYNLVFNGSTWDRQRGDTEGTHMVGNEAHDAVDAGNPVKIGGKANDSAPTQVANADRVDAWLDRRGALFTRLTDSSGSAIATGVQYSEDGALGTNGQGTLVVARRDDALGTLTPAEDDAVGLRVNNRGALWIKPDGTVTVDGSGVTQPVSGTVTVDALPNEGQQSMANSISVAIASDQSQIETLLEGTTVTGVHDVAATGSSVKVGGVYRSTPPNVANGDFADLLIDEAGRLQVNVVTAPSSATAGDVAHDAADGGNPVKIGGKANDSAPTQVANADRVDGWLDRRGAFMTRLVDASGAAVSTGTQYVEDAALGATGTGTLVVGRRDDALATLSPAEDDAVGLRVNARGALWAELDAIANDAADSGNPVKIGMQARTTFPTAVADADRVNATADSFGRQLTSHIDPALQKHISFNATSTQTGTDVWDPAAGKRIAVTSVVIGAYGTTAARVILWFGDNADTTYTAGTDQTLLAASFAPSSTSKPGLVFTPAVPVFCTTADRELHITTDAGISIDVTIEGYEW